MTLNHSVKQKQTNELYYQLQYIEKHDHSTWMTISKMKNMIISKNEKLDHQTWITISKFKLMYSNT